MLSSKLLVYISLLITIVQSHELLFHRRGHASVNSKRFLKNRSLEGIFGPLDANAASSSVTSVASQTDASAVSQSTAPDISSQSTPSSTSASATSTGAASAASSATSATSSSPTSSSTATNTSSSTSTSTSTTSRSINSTPLTATPTLNVVASTITSTQSVSATPSDTAAPIQSAATKTKTTTVTALIAVAASLGGIAILWTIFRKWKLSSSKEFDRRLNPITDWQPTNGEDDIPGVRRAPSSSSSFHSGGGSAHGHSSSHGAGYGNEHGLAPPDHDFTAGPSNSVPIGGYADLARASSPNPPMQQTLGRGPSFNRGYDVGVPLHHQTGYGTYDGYDYNGGGARY